MSVTTPPRAAEISLFFTDNDHNSKHLLSASVEGPFLEFPLLISQQPDPETVWELRRTFLFMLLPPNGFQPAWIHMLL